MPKVKNLKLPFCVIENHGKDRYTGEDNAFCIAKFFNEGEAKLFVEALKKQYENNPESKELGELSIKLRK